MPHYLTALLSLLLLAQCHHDVQPKSEPKEASFDEAFLLDKGQRLEVKGQTAEALTLQLLNLEDSRCPKEAVCVWMGNATALVQVSQSGRQTEQLAFCIGDCRADQPRTKQTLRTCTGTQCYDITLLHVLPNPTQAAKNAPGQVKLLVQPVP